MKVIQLQHIASAIAMLLFDMITISFLITSSFLHSSGTENVDYVLGSLILTDVVARVWISNTPWKTLLHPLGLLDLVVVVSLLAPFDR